MLPRPAAVCYWVVIPWLQACVPPGTGWECACPGVSTQAKLTATNFKFPVTRGRLQWCQQAQRAAYQHRSVSEHQGPPNTCSAHSRCCNGAFWCNTQLGECLSWSSVHNILELSCAFDMLEPQLVPAGKLCLVA